MPKVIPPVNLGFILVLIISFSYVLHGQPYAARQKKFTVEANIPFQAASFSSFSIELVIKKDPKFFGAMRIVQLLPEGFDLIKPLPGNSKVSSVGHEFTILFDTIPPGAEIAILYSVEAGNIAPAIYPLIGSVFLDGSTESFHTMVNVEGFRQKTVDVAEKKKDVAIKVNLTLPALVKATDTFSFVTTLNKAYDYNKAGQIRQKLPPGFEPLPTTIAGSNFSFGNNEVLISWKEMASGERISISYEVNVGDAPSGIFPIITEYSDESGLRFAETTGISVENSKQTERPKLTIADTSVYRISFDFPEEVLQNEPFVIRLLVQKGFALGPGTVEIDFPPGISVEAQNDLNFKYEKLNGRMKIIWNTLPADPLFETNLILATDQIKKAVYLLSASFIFDGKVRAHCFKNLTIVSQKTSDRTNKALVDKSLEHDVRDTVAIFAKIDNLLEKYKSSSTGRNTENEQLAKSKVQNIPSNIETVQGNNGKNNEKSQVLEKKSLLQTNIPAVDGICYRIQIIASKFKLTGLAKSLKARGFDEQLYENLEGNWYRYLIGTFRTFDEAKEYLKMVQGKGYKDAFVVEFQDGKRIKSYY